VGDAIRLAGEEEDEAFQEFISGACFSIQGVSRSPRSSFSEPFQDVVFHPVWENLDVELLDLFIRNLIRIARPFGDGPEFRPESQGKKLRIEGTPLNLVVVVPAKRLVSWNSKGTNPFS